MRMSDKKQTAVYGNIHKAIIDARIKFSKNYVWGFEVEKYIKYDDVDSTLHDMTEIIWTEIKKTLNVED